MTTFSEVKQALDAHGQAIDAAINKYEAELKQVRNEIDELAQRRDIATDGGGRGFNPLARIANDPGVMALRDGTTKSAILQIKGSLPQLLTKSGLLVGDTPASDNTGFDVRPQRAPGVFNDARRQLTLLDVLPRMAVTSGSFEFNSLDSYTNSADYQLQQGDPKAQGDMPTELRTCPIVTIAHHIPASRQVLADEPALQATISSLLAFGVAQKAERELIQGIGGAGRIAGLTHVSNFTAMTAGPTLADAVAEAAAALNIAGWNPTVVLCHPTTWKNARTERADAGGGPGTGPYIAGSWAAPAQASVWSIPLVQTPWLAPDEVLVCDTSQVYLLDRQSVTVEIGRVANQFVENALTLLGEARMGLAVFAPSAVRFGTLSS